MLFIRFGRYVVATRDISPGEIIFKEDPLEFGPNNTNDVLCCVGCGKYEQMISLFSSLNVSFKTNCGSQKIRMYKM